MPSFHREDKSLWSWEFRDSCQHSSLGKFGLALHAGHGCTQPLIRVCPTGAPRNLWSFQQAILLSKVMSKVWREAGPINADDIGHCLFMLMFLKSYLPLTKQLCGSTGENCCYFISKIVHVSWCGWVILHWVFTGELALKFGSSGFQKDLCLILNMNHLYL